ncbi:MAG: hypothetical protein ACI9BD_000122 [Candidatus Marinamargulisbacteria bacterium]|jgi:hypothetical protein
MQPNSLPEQAARPRANRPQLTVNTAIERAPVDYRDSAIIQLLKQTIEAFIESDYKPAYAKNPAQFSRTPEFYISKAIELSTTDRDAIGVSKIDDDSNPEGHIHLLFERLLAEKGLFEQVTRGIAGLTL